MVIIETAEAPGAPLHGFAILIDRLAPRRPRPARRPPFPRLPADRAGAVLDRDLHGRRQGRAHANYARPRGHRRGRRHLDLATPARHRVTGRATELGPRTRACACRVRSCRSGRHKVPGAPRNGRPERLRDGQGTATGRPGRHSGRASSRRRTPGGPPSGPPPHQEGVHAPSC
jgi:hypothetical protein